MPYTSTSSAQRNPSGTHRLHQPALEPADWILHGKSFAIRQLRSQVQRVAPYVRIALLRGEPGSGKQLVARAIHARAGAEDSSFVVCKASFLAESFALAKAEAAANASVPAIPLLHDAAKGGTLYLRGVDELSASHQAALLRFLLASEYRRSAASSVDYAGNSCLERQRAYASVLASRILISSNRDLRILSSIGQFRQDLYNCIGAVELLVPPLRQRAEDIPDLAAWLLRRIAGATSQSSKLISPAALTQLQRHPWPKNICELETVLTRAASLTEGSTIEPRHLLASAEGNPGSGSTEQPREKVDLLEAVVQRHILEVLTRCEGNKLRAAERLGISRSTLYRMLGNITR